MDKMLLTAMPAMDKFIILRAAEISGFKKIISVEDIGNGYINVYTISNEDHGPFWNTVTEIQNRSTMNKLRRSLLSIGRQ